MARTVHADRAATAVLRRCTAAGTRLTLVGPISPVTGEHGRMFALVDRSGHPCVFDGTPAIALYAGKKRLRFAYVRSAGRPRWRYTSSTAPARRVVVEPGHAAYFLVAKYRCDLGIRATASSVLVRLPGGPRRMRAALPPHGGGFGVGELDYCRYPARQRTAPGNVIDVSAVAATAQGTVGSPSG